MPAALGRDLVLDVHRRDARPRELADRTRDGEGVAPAGVDVDEERQGDGGRDPAGVRQDVVVGSVVEDWDLSSLGVGQCIVSLPEGPPFFFTFNEYASRGLPDE